jgi:transposase
LYRKSTGRLPKRFMESTGVYWMLVYAVLEGAGGFTLLVVNAQHAKAIKSLPQRRLGPQTRAAD